MKKIFAFLVLAFSFSMMVGCTTTTRIVAEGETIAPTSGVNEDDVRYIVKKAIQDVFLHSKRYSTPESPRRVVNVKKVKIDTMTRGSNANYLANTLAQCIEEELLNSDTFYIYNEAMASQPGSTGAPIVPEFIMDSTLMQQNVRLDNGDYTKEYSWNIQLTDWNTKMKFWVKRIPLRKIVDKTRVME